VRDICSASRRAVCSASSSRAMPRVRWVSISSRPCSYSMRRRRASSSWARSRSRSSWRSFQLDEGLLGGGDLLIDLLAGGRTGRVHGTGGGMGGRRGGAGGGDGGGRGDRAPSTGLEVRVHEVRMVKVAGHGRDARSEGVEVNPDVHGGVPGGASRSCRRAGVPPASGVEHPWRDEGRRGRGAIGDGRGTGDVGGRGRAKRPGRPRAAGLLSTHNFGMRGVPGSAPV
jgi:hypothetical protein